MAQDFLEEIYKIGKVIAGLKNCAEMCLVGDGWQVSQLWNAQSNSLTEIINETIAVNVRIAQEMQTACLRCREKINSLSECAILLENELIPALYKCVSISGDIDVTEGNWRLCSSKTGLLTIQNTKTGEYLHSPDNPLWEAYKRADFVYKPNMKNIVIWGCGLGYNAYQLWEKSYRSADIYLFENRPEMIEYAKEYGVLDWIDEDKLHIVINENAEALFDDFTKVKVDYNKAILLISDWVQDCVGDELRQNIIDFSENQKAAARYSERFDVNYHNNIDKFTGLIADLRDRQKEADESRNGEYIVVAAGPSLNKEMEYLKSCVGKKTIIAVDGALKKLLANDIYPDYVTAFDPNVTLMHYIEGIEEKTEDITLIADSVVFWGYLNHYRGPVYRVMAADSKLNIADKERLGLTDLGYHGTISGLAIEEAIYFGAKRIELIGLDLSYPGGKTHAEGIGVDVSAKVEGSLEVVSVNGDMVSTNLTFDKFRREIEEQIARHPEVEFVNLSKDGAFIRGTFCGRWYEQFPSSEDEAESYFSTLANDGLLSWKEKYYLLRKWLRKKESSAANASSKKWLSDVFGEIAVQFMGELGIDRNEPAEAANRQNEHLIYLITSHLSLFGDSVSEQVLKDAYRLQSELGRNVLIINTCEAEGGCSVIVRDESTGDANAEAKSGLVGGENAKAVSEEASGETICYMGIRIPYFKCIDNMPDTSYIREILKFMATNITDGIIAYDTYSLFAISCRSIGMVEYRYENS